VNAAADQLELDAGTAGAVNPATAHEITVALVTGVYERFAEPEWLCMQQVAIGGRSLDVVAIRMWSRAVINAFEVKATRSDWLREMRKPEKADAVIGACDHFWLVTAKGVAKPEEIPEHWGWLVLQPNGKVRSAKAAPPLDTRIPHREFWASLLGLAHRGGASSARIEREKRTEYDRGYKAGQEQATLMQHQGREAEELLQARRALEALGWSGLYELASNAPRIKAAIAAGHAAQQIEYLRDQAKRTADELSAVLRRQEEPT